MYYNVHVYGVSVPSLLIESTNSMILKPGKAGVETGDWEVKEEKQSHE